MAPRNNKYNAAETSLETFEWSEMTFINDPLFGSTNKGRQQDDFAV